MLHKIRVFPLLIVFILLTVSSLNIIWAQSTPPIILNLAWSPDGTLIAMIDNGGNVEVVTADQTTSVFQYERSMRLIKATVGWSPQGDLLAAGIGNRIYIWQVSNWQLLHEFEVGSPNNFFTWITTKNIPEGVQTITWSVDGRYIVIGTYSYETIVWDIQVGEYIYRKGELSGGGPGRVWLNEDGWMGDGATKVNAFTGEWKTIAREDYKYAFGGSVEGGTTEPRPDNTQIAWGTDSGSLLIIDLNTMRGIQGFKVADWDFHETRRVISDISWSADWNFIAVASRDGELFVANLLTADVTSILKINGEIITIDWSPQTNEITYSGISQDGQPILSSIDISGFGGVPTYTPIFTPTLLPPTSTPIPPTATPCPSLGPCTQSSNN